MIPMPQPEQSIALVVEDILGNNYEIICPIVHGHDSGGLQTVVKVGETEYIGYYCSYIVLSAGSPLLAKDDYQ